MLLPLLAAAVMYLLASLAGGSWLVFASSAALVLPLVALLLPARVEGITVRREPAARGLPGRPLDVLLTIRNTGGGSTSPLRLHDTSDGLSEAVLAIPGLRPGTEVVVRTERTAQRRGVFDSGTAVLASNAPLGLLRVTRDVTVEGLVIVHPAVTPVPRALGVSTHLAGEIPLSMPGAGTEVLGLRDWRSGDSARSVSARATARHGRPLVLERERGERLGLVLLAGGPGYGASWERAVSYAASLHCLSAVADGTVRSCSARRRLAGWTGPACSTGSRGVDRVHGLEPDVMMATARAAAGSTLVVLGAAGHLWWRPGKLRPHL